MVKTHQKEHGIPYSSLVLGQSGVGKSAIAKAYYKSFPQKLCDGIDVKPVVYVSLTDTTTPKGLVEQLLHALNVTTFNRTNNLLELQDRLLKLLKKHKVEFVIIDEVQECLPKVSGPARQKIIKQLTWLIDNSKIPFAMFGTPIAENLLTFGVGTEDYKSEEQFSRRCYSPIRLTPIPPKSNSWLKAVNYFVSKRSEPELTTSDELQIDLINRLYVATEGRFGLLEKFMIHLPLDLNILLPESRETMAQVFYRTISDKKLNPFIFEDYDDVKIEAAIQQLKRELI